MTNSVMTPKLAPAPFKPCIHVSFRPVPGAILRKNATYEKEIRVFLLAGALDLAIGRDDLDLDDVIQTRTPHTRHGTEATLRVPR